MSNLELHEACAMGDSDLVNSLLRANRCDVNQPDMDWNNRTPLHWASTKGAAEIISVLLEHGADGAARTTDGWTAAHFAAEAGKLSALVALHRGGAPMLMPDSSGDTPRRVAQIYGHVKVVDYLFRLEEDAAAQSAK